MPYEALSACVQPQEKSDRLTDKPGDWFHSYDRSPDVKAKVLGSSKKKTRRWVISVSRHERSGLPTVVRQRNRMATFLYKIDLY